jgi:hypothetical protein
MRPIDGTNSSPDYSSLCPMSHIQAKFDGLSFDTAIRLVQNGIAESWWGNRTKNPNPWTLPCRTQLYSLGSLLEVLCSASS